MSWANYRHYRKHRNLLPEDYDLIESQLRRRKRPEDIAANTGWSTWTIGKIAATKNYDDYKRQSRDTWERWKKDNIIPMTEDEMRNVYRQKKTR